ncbi:PTS system cellobiose-specific IIC component [Enterococcus sp. PF1-24]|uniref:PTS sugar transporter subunit IIC n=1 Tax=unclassified Enterococcus TaxID=2608891 RepID=UPI002477119D|nr:MULTISPECIES: PTS transporter subunit EIIC [unclassified Enterococcus]MDH6365069.1 PTS system cellobiose-specific IIC component [Enterococcus sp. PFB1-1]MDH6402158.1 PTS system cellobiose-specific IIC component [Enterococcus sp. PF1-24]
MEKKSNGFGEKLNQVIIKFSNNIVIKTVANGMMLTLPVTIVGSMLMVIQMIPNLPDIVNQACTLGTTISSNFIALYIVLGMAYAMAREVKSDIPASMILSAACFLLLTPITQFDVGGDKPVAALELGYLGSKGIFVGMISSILVSWCFAKLCEKNITFKMPDSVPPFISKTFAAIIPAAILFFAAIIISVIFNGTKYGNIHDFIYTLLQAPLEKLGGTIWSALFIMFLSELLWWFGIHGSNVTSSIITVLYASQAYANMEAVAAGGTAENVINSFFLDAYKGPRALALAVILLLLCRSEKFKSIGKISIVPSVFGITEPMKFGIPQILNPLLFVPLTLAAPMCIAIAYVATLIGFLPITSMAIPRNLPTFLTGFLAGGWQGLVVQIIQFVAVVLLYLPFMKRLDIRETTAESQTTTAD